MAIGDPNTNTRKERARAGGFPTSFQTKQVTKKTRKAKKVGKVNPKTNPNRSTKSRAGGTTRKKSRINR